MNSAVQKLAEEIQALSLDDQVILAQSVWDRIEHFTDPEIEQAWMEESERRWQEIEQGKVQCVSAEEAMKRARASLNK
jgi:putative addiction module component (TIGR02574 family)